MSIDNSSDSPNLTTSDKEARRLLEIAILFENATSAISTQTIRNTIYSYCKSDESARKAFMRDRQKLVLCGLVIKEDSSSSGQHLWTVDTAHSYASNNVLTPLEAATLNVACMPFVNDPSFPYSNELRMALTKIDQAYNEQPRVYVRPETRNVSIARSMLEQCAANEHPATITYDKANGIESVRTIGICGFFAFRNNTYVVGKRLDTNSNEDPHSYNISRVRSVTPLNKEHFKVPNDFNIRDYPKLPFQIGPTAYVAKFYVPTNELDNLRTSSMGKGTISQESTSNALWQVEVSNTVRAASWAIAHALIPLEPKPLRGAWATILEEDLQHDGEKWASSR